MISDNFPYLVEKHCTTRKEYLLILQWLCDQFGGSWPYKSNGFWYKSHYENSYDDIELRIRFKNNEDLLLFKLYFS